MKFTVTDAALPHVSHKIHAAEIPDPNEYCFCQNQCVTAINMRDGTIIRAKGSAIVVRAEAIHVKI